MSTLLSTALTNPNYRFILRPCFHSESQSIITSLARHWKMEGLRFPLVESSPSHLYGGAGFSSNSLHDSCTTVSPAH
jgi:hypothetical protein